MKIIVSGASGLVGSALVPALGAAGHEVVRLVRTSTRNPSGESVWDPATGTLDSAVINGADVVINLNGRSIAEGRWTSEVKEELRSSRLDSTRTLAQAIGNSENPPGLLISASAVGYYGDRGDEQLDESSEIGAGYLAELSGDWETAALAARSEQTTSRSPSVGGGSGARRRPRTDVDSIQAGAGWSDRFGSSILAMDWNRGRLRHHQIHPRSQRS